MQLLFSRNFFQVRNFLKIKIQNLLDLTYLADEILSNHSFHIDLTKVSNYPDMIEVENWSDFHDSKIFAKSTFSTLPMDKYTCYAECIWLHNYRCNYLIFDNFSCYFLSDTHLSGLKNETVQLSENAVMIKSKQFLLKN